MCVDIKENFERLSSYLTLKPKDENTNNKKIEADLAGQDTNTSLFEALARQNGVVLGEMNNHYSFCLHNRISIIRRTWFKFDPGPGPFFIRGFKIA